MATNDLIRRDEGALSVGQRADLDVLDAWRGLVMPQGRYPDSAICGRRWPGTFYVVVALRSWLAWRAALLWQLVAAMGVRRS
jgi:hypothetical protein